MQNLISAKDSIVLKAIYTTNQETGSNNPKFQFKISLTALLIFLLTLFANKDTLFKDNPLIPPAQKVEKPFEQFIGTSTGNGVNVRSEPTVEYGTIHNMLYKEIIFNVVERSKEKSQIDIKGVTHTDYWYKVKFTYQKNGKKFKGEGWVYGHFIKQIRNPDIA